MKIPYLKLFFVMLFGIAILGLQSQPFYYVNIDGTNDDFSTSSNNSGLGAINWLDNTMADLPDGILPPEGSELIIKSGNLTIDRNCTFKTITVYGATGGQILVAPGVKLTVTNGINVSGFFTANPGSTIRVHSGGFTAIAGGTIDVTGAIMEGTAPVEAGGTVIGYVPGSVISLNPVPVSLWTIAAILILMGGIIFWRNRKRQIA